MKLKVSVFLPTIPLSDISRAINRNTFGIQIWKGTNFRVQIRANKLFKRCIFVLSQNKSHEFQCQKSWKNNFSFKKFKRRKKVFLQIEIQSIGFYNVQCVLLQGKKLYSTFNIKHKVIRLALKWWWWQSET